MPELWKNTSTHAEVGRQGDNNTLHECVFISPTRAGMRLDHKTVKIL